MPPATLSAPKARIACFPCRLGKRRCDKALPSCQLCERKGVDCSYPQRRGEKYESPAHSQSAATWNSTPTPEGFIAESPEDNRTVPASDPLFTTATAIRFIAPQLFQDAQMEIPQTNLVVPAEVTEHVGSVSQIRDIASSFFKPFHHWMPIISKTRFYSTLLNPLSPRRCELSLLVLCMKLYSTTPPGRLSDGRTPLYTLAKKFHAQVESAGIVSIHVLQAAVLIAYYEVGQAIFPAAYLTVGACARYGAALGVDKLMGSLTGDGDLARSWIEIEEMRRVWWAVLMLDRLLNLESPSRILATQDPAFDNYLPVDDEAFDNGTTKPKDAVSISCGFELKMGLFSRLAQATYLLSEALRYLASAQTTPSGAGLRNIDDTSQLRRTLQSLITLADQEAVVRQLQFCSHSSLCYTAILLLQRQHWQRNGFSRSAEDLFPETIPALDALCRMSSCLLRDCVDNPCIKDNLSIYLIQVAYQVLMTLIAFGQGNPDEETSERITAVKELLRNVSKRWRISDVFISIAEALEATALAAI